MTLQKIIELLLKNRGIKTKKQQEEFFLPKDPQKISVKELGISENQLKKAVLRIKQAIKNKEKIIVYGDYDVDGICSTAVLWETLDSLGADALPYIPSRFTEGYGLSPSGIENLKVKIKNCSLIITVDNGIVANESVEYANKQGINVIITDHHQLGKTKPKAHAIVHTTKISGSAVAWILSRELAKNQNLSEEHLGLGALGTISDILPLVELNRSIATWGLRELRNTNRPGIKALCEEAVVKQNEIDTYHIGFMLSPRINAAGRVEHAMDSLRLLCIRRKDKAQELARKLGVTNRLRQEKTESIVKHADETHGSLWKDGNLPKLLFIHHESYEEGVVGIAASRLVDLYHRPAIVVSTGSEFSKASARSIVGVNIVELLKKAGDEFFDSIGGHPMAAGFTVPTEKLEALGIRLTQIAEKQIKDSALVKTLRVDCEIDFSDISVDLYSELLKFQPFGFGNLEPTFETSGVNVLDMHLLGKEKNHIKMVVEKSGITFSAIGFRMGEWYTKLSPEFPVNIVYAIELDTWNGNKNLQLKLKNISV